LGSIAFTGNRDYTDLGALYRGLDGVKADTYYFGGARGADADALQYIARTQPGSERIVVVPNTLDDQPGAIQPIIRENATKIIELKNSGLDRYRIRNRFIVDNADRVVAFTDGRKSGGTFNTITYAESQGKEVQIITWVNVDESLVVAMNEEELINWLTICENEKIPEIAVKGMVIASIKKFPRSSWPAILNELHRLR